MDKLSCASAYRTAAILAAFSRTDMSGDDPSWSAAPAICVNGAGASRWRIASRHLFRQVGRAIELIRGASNGLRPRDPARDPPRRWTLPRPVASPVPSPTMQGRPLVSHFAFCEEVDLQHPGTTL